MFLKSLARRGAERARLASGAAAAIRSTCRRSLPVVVSARTNASTGAAAFIAPQRDGGTSASLTDVTEKSDASNQRIWFFGLDFGGAAQNRAIAAACNRAVIVAQRLRWCRCPSRV